MADRYTARHASSGLQHLAAILVWAQLKGAVREGDFGRPLLSVCPAGLKLVILEVRRCVEVIRILEDRGHSGWPFGSMTIGAVYSSSDNKLS